jgi:hypothetical protein
LYFAIESLSCKVGAQFAFPAPVIEIDPADIPFPSAGASIVMNREDQANNLGQLIARCWSDENFKREFLADPLATLKAERADLELPADACLKVVQDTEHIIHFVLPARPTELSDEQLESVAGGEDIVDYGPCRATGCGGCGRCRGCYSYGCRYC